MLVVLDVGGKEDITDRRLTIPRTLSTPFAIPRLRYMALEKRTDPNANEDRRKSFPANSDAEYCGYDRGIYANTHWKRTKPEAA